MSSTGAVIGTITPPEESTQGLIKDAEAQSIQTTAASISKAPNGIPTPLPELDAGQLIISRTPNPRPVPAPDSPDVASCSYCTDHMVTANWSSTHGWAAPTLTAYGPLTLMPIASCLQYATTCFEGLKLYRGHDQRLRLFRPALNTQRMLHSAVRIALPAFPPDQLQALIARLCAVDGARWLPQSRPGSFLYLRPTLVGTTAALGVSTPRDATLYLVACLFPDMQRGMDARLAQAATSSGLRLWASRESECRAWPGGFGHAKVGANYGPTLAATGAARARGYDQVLWLFGSEGRVTEAGASNFFVVWEGADGRRELVTAPLDERMILDGVTRRSVLELARDRLAGELRVVERPFTMDEVQEGVRGGKIVEAFVVGTAYFVASVSAIHFRGVDLEIPLSPGPMGKYAGLFKTWMSNIMYGEEQHPWGVVVEEE